MVNPEFTHYKETILGGKLSKKFKIVWKYKTETYSVSPGGKPWRAQYSFWLDKDLKPNKLFIDIQAFAIINFRPIEKYTIKNYIPTEQCAIENHIPTAQRTFEDIPQTYTKHRTNYNSNVVNNLRIRSIITVDNDNTEPFEYFYKNVIKN